MSRSSIRFAGLLLVLLLASVTVARQFPKGNPLVQASQAIGATGLGKESLPEKAGWPFVPAAGRAFVKEYVASLSTDAAERSALETGIVGVIEGYEKVAESLNQTHDPATALAFSVAILTSAAKGTELDDQAFLSLAPRFRAILAKVPASDRQKQEFYEWSLSSAGMVVSLASATSDPSSQGKIKGLAEVQLLALVGAKSDAIQLKGASVEIRATAKPNSTSTAAGFSFAVPVGWRKDGVWTVGEKRDGVYVSSAMIRVPPAVPAKGAFADSLRSAWKQYVPEEFHDKAGGMVFRRYLGDGLVSLFVCGAAHQKGQDWNTLFTVYLIDCGASWQPVVLAQTWQNVTSTNPVGAFMSADFSFNSTARIAEEMFRTFTCPAAKGRPLIDRAAMIGKFKYGNSSTLQWENVSTGSTSMTVVSYGGTLDLLPTGAFSETMSGASGRVGALKFNGMTGKGSWSLANDILILKYSQYDQGNGAKIAEHRFRVAGVVTFTDGVKVLVLKSKLDEPINAITVQDRSNYYSTDKK